MIDKLTNKGHIPIIDLMDIFNDYERMLDISKAAFAIADKTLAKYLKLPYTPIRFRIDKKHFLFATQKMLNNGQNYITFYFEPKINDHQQSISFLIRKDFKAEIAGHFEKDNELIIMDLSKPENIPEFKILYQYVGFIVNCILFMNLKNVKIIDEPSANEKRKWNARYPLQKRTIYKIIVLNIRGNQYRRINTNDFIDDKNHRRSPAFHLVRGYVRSKPKSDDIIYIDNYERGLLKYGEIVKDYKVRDNAIIR